MNKQHVSEALAAARSDLKGGKSPREVMDWLMGELIGSLDTAARRERILTLCVQHGAGREPKQLVEDATMFLAWIDGENCEPMPSAS
jgi:hypothetical protein